MAEQQGKINFAFAPGPLPPTFPTFPAHIACPDSGQAAFRALLIDHLWQLSWGERTLAT